MEDMHGHQIGGGYGREDDISDSESVPDTPDDSSTESKDSSAESDDSSAKSEDSSLLCCFTALLINYLTVLLLQKPIIIYQLL